MDSLRLVTTPVVNTTPSTPGNSGDRNVVYPLQKAAPSQGSLPNAEQIEQKRHDAVKQAASNVFVVSDQSFTIFKDNNGQYVTRYTSLRDGRVTYIPEPELLRRAQAQSESVDVQA